MAYLDDHPNPNLAQQRPRRDQPSGVIVVHTAESALDATGEDTGAEGVARYIGVRTTYGSYHRLADSDSVVAVARFDMTTYGDGTGSNDHAIHISFACAAADWPRMSAERRAAFIRNGAKAAAEANAWLVEHRGITVPPRRITRAQSDAKVPGFISHGERDPGRRTDPGPAFPWTDFIEQYAALTQEDQMTPDQERKLNQAAADAADAKKLSGQAVRMLDRQRRRQLDQTGRVRSDLAKLRKKDTVTPDDLEHLETQVAELTRLFTETDDQED